jgi:hypothetical protein
MQIYICTWLKRSEVPQFEEQVVEVGAGGPAVPVAGQDPGEPLLELGQGEGLPVVDHPGPVHDQVVGAAQEVLEAQVDPAVAVPEPLQQGPGPLREVPLGLRGLAPRLPAEVRLLVLVAGVRRAPQLQVLGPERNPVDLGPRSLEAGLLDDPLLFLGQPHVEQLQALLLLAGCQRGGVRWRQARRGRDCLPGGLWDVHEGQLRQPLAFVIA